jgi:hypothetical protein
LPPKDDEVEAPSEALDLHKCSSSWVIIGFGLEGKLLERAWKPVFWLEETAIFPFQRVEIESGESEQSESCNLPFSVFALPRYIYIYQGVRETIGISLT